MKQAIHTSKAPAAIGSYSQAIQVGKTVYFSGQIPLDPVSMLVVEGDLTTQAERVFDNLQVVAEAAGGHLDAIVKLTVFLVDLSQFAVVNDVMKKYFKSPFPARTTIQVSALPKGVPIEIDAIMVLD